MDESEFIKETMDYLKNQFGFCCGDMEKYVKTKMHLAWTYGYLQGYHESQEE